MYRKTKRKTERILLLAALGAFFFFASLQGSLPGVVPPCLLALPKHRRRSSAAARGLGAVWSSKYVVGGCWGFCEVAMMFWKMINGMLKVKHVCRCLENVWDVGAYRGPL